MSPLHFNTSQLLKSDIGSTRGYDFSSDQPLDLDGSVARDIAGRIKFTLTNFGIVAVAHVQAVLELTCARCLEPFQTWTEISFEEEYQPLIDIATGLPSTTPRSDAAFFISRNHTIDLTEAIRQHLVLAVEMVPVHSPDCRGLCPTCGANLNVEQCQCPPAEEDSPFAVLQGLLSGTEAHE